LAQAPTVLLYIEVKKMLWTLKQSVYQVIKSIALQQIAWLIFLQRYVLMVKLYLKWELNCC